MTRPEKLGRSLAVTLTELRHLDRRLQRLPTSAAFRTTLRENGAVRVLGINCNTSEAHLAVADDGLVADGQPERLRPAAGIEAGDRLIEFIRDAHRAFAKISPDHIVLLLPEGRQPGASYKGLMPRIAIETLLRVAAAQDELPLDLLTRQRVRANLQIQKGPLDAHLALAGTPVGKYWTTGRGLAALAAVAYRSS